MMLTWIWLGIMAIAVVGLLLVLQQRSGKMQLGSSRQAALPSLRRTVFSLQIGDIVQYEGADWVVEGQLTFNDQGYTWMEYMLQDDDAIRWLTVEEDDRVEVCWMQPVSDLEIAHQPPKRLTYAGISYQQVNTGTASMTRKGTTLNKQAQRCQYFDYSGANDQLLAIEDWDGEYEVSIGHRIHPGSLSLLPGDGRRVYDD